MRNYNNKHDFKLYKNNSDDIILNSLLVSKTYYLFRAIGFVNSNIVLIGANGSGKTTFANSIRDKLESTDNGIVIPAQKILIFPSYDFIPTYKSAYSKYQSRQKEILDDKQTFNASKSDDIPYSLTQQYGSELRILVSALLGERMARRDEYCSSINNGP
jgi:ATPase subunit of ABC transporter with duplicated ATPase domains